MHARVSMNADTVSYFTPVEEWIFEREKIRRYQKHKKQRT